MSDLNPFQREKECDNCNNAYPENLISPYVVPKTDKKTKAVRQETIQACPLCISKLAGERSGSKEPFDFSADPEMMKKIAYAEALSEQRKYSTSGKKKRSTSSDKDDDSLTDEERQTIEDDEAKRLAEEEELQRAIEEEERQKAEQSEGVTDMLDRSESTSADDDNNETSGRRKRGSN